MLYVLNVLVLPSFRSLLLFSPFIAINPLAEVAALKHIDSSAKYER
jgi:hypothetical protein